MPDSGANKRLTQFNPNLLEFSHIAADLDFYLRALQVLSFFVQCGWGFTSGSFLAIRSVAIATGAALGSSSFGTFQSLAPQ